MSENSREKLLLQMYDQMFNDIDRHIIVVWQSVGVLVGAFAIFALAEKQVVSIDIAAALIVLISGWSLAHVYDSAYWYNRNLVIIANIERVFLRQSDLKDVHYYFGKHRPDNKMITHLRLQFVLGVGVALIVVAFHVLNRVLPGIAAPFSSFDPQRMFPYIVAVVMLIYLMRLRAYRKRGYAEFIKNSPGVTIDSTGIDYGEGHGFGPATSPNVEAEPRRDSGGSAAGSTPVA